MIESIDTIFGDMEYDNNYALVASISQDICQFDNYSIKLYKHNETGELVQIDDMCNDSNFFSVSADEIINNDYDAYIRDCARNWAANGEEDERTQLIAWGLENPESYKVDEDFKGSVKVLIVSHYYGYAPVGYLTDDNGCEIVFDSYQEAQDLINEMDNKTYYLSHGEAGRPSYFIVEVN